MVLNNSKHSGHKPNDWAHSLWHQQQKTWEAYLKLHTSIWLDPFYYLHLILLTYNPWVMTQQLKTTVFDHQSWHDGALKAHLKPVWSVSDAAAFSFGQRLHRWHTKKLGVCAGVWVDKWDMLYHRVSRALLHTDISLEHMPGSCCGRWIYVFVSWLMSWRGLYCLLLRV